MDGKLVKRPVKLGVGNYERVEIVEGLTEKDLIARPLNGVELIEGMSVEVEEKAWP